MKTQEWRPTECAPINYPMYLHTGYFTGVDDSTIYIPDGRTVDYGWGAMGSIHIVGEDYKAIPKRLDVLWLSFTENKYYLGQLDLPVKTIANVFKEGYLHPRTRQKETYSRISIGMAPGGLIVVWLVGSCYQIEVAIGQGAQVEMDWKDVIPTTNLTQQQYTGFILENRVDEATRSKIKSGDIPVNRWKNYRTKYPWRCTLTHRDSFIGQTVQIEMYNGEKTVCFLEEDNQDFFASKAIPKNLRVTWQDKRGYEYAARIYFEEVEIFNGFETLFKDPKTKQVALIVHIDKYNSNITLQLQNETDQILLTQAEIHIYHLTA